MFAQYQRSDNACINVDILCCLTKLPAKITLSGDFY